MFYRTTKSVFVHIFSIVVCTKSQEYKLRPHTPARDNTSMVCSTGTMLPYPIAPPQKVVKNKVLGMGFPFAHPLTSFWSHLEASNCHIVKKQKNRCFLPGISKIPYFTVFSLSWSYRSGAHGTVVSALLVLISISFAAKK